MTSKCRPWIFKSFSDLDWLSVFLKRNKEIFVYIFQVQNSLIITNKKEKAIGGNLTLWRLYFQWFIILNCLSWIRCKIIEWSCLFLEPHIFADNYVYNPKDNMWNSKTIMSKQSNTKWSKWNPGPYNLADMGT
jgi:hypothetical protein